MTRLIHPTAIIHPQAELHPTVEVGPYTVIGEKVKIGANTKIRNHVTIEGPVEIGEDNLIFPGAAIALETQDLKYKGAESWVKIGNGNRIREYVTINRATEEGGVTAIGNNNLLMACVHVAHNCIITDQVVIANGVALAGHVYIEPRAIIGGVLGVHQFVHIGQLAMIGGMSRVDRDVPPFMLIEGNPARVRSLNLIGLKRAGFNDQEIAQLKQAFRLLYRSNYTLTQALIKLEEMIDLAPCKKLYNFLLAATHPERRGLIPGSQIKSKS